MPETIVLLLHVIRAHHHRASGVLGSIGCTEKNLIRSGRERERIAARLKCRHRGYGDTSLPRLHGKTRDAFAGGSPRGSEEIVIVVIVIGQAREDPIGNDGGIAEILHEIHRVSRLIAGILIRSGRRADADFFIHLIHVSTAMSPPWNGKIFE